MEIEGKHVYITGANRGIGFHLAKELNERGAFVHLLIRTTPPDNFLGNFKDPNKVYFHNCNLTSVESVNECAKEIINGNYPVDILINNAGVISAGLIEDQKDELIFESMMVNLYSPILLIKKLIPKMHKNKESLIINNSSVAALIYLPVNSTYTATKSGIFAFTKALELELKSTSISTLVLITPDVDTDMHNSNVDLFKRYYNYPKRNLINPSDYAKTVAESILKNKVTLLPSNLLLKLMIFFAKYNSFLFKKIISKLFHYRIK